MPPLQDLQAIASVTGQERHYISFELAMVSKPSRQERLDALTKICLALPETRREDKGSHCAFLVGKKTFAYYLDNHHGDNIVSVCCKVLPGENTFLIESNRGQVLSPGIHRSKRMDWSPYGPAETELVRGQRINPWQLFAASAEETRIPGRPLTNAISALQTAFPLRREPESDWTRLHAGEYRGRDTGPREHKDWNVCRAPG